MIKRVEHTNATLALECGVAAATFPGEPESGDLHVIAMFTGGALVAAIDGLGHGRAAAAAARAARDALLAGPEEPATSLVQRCHERLRRTRGVALSLVSFDIAAAAFTWIGVGNVEGVLIRADPGARVARDTIMLRGGVVGYQLPPLRATTMAVSPGDVLVLATDGIHGGFAGDVARGRSAQATADSILAKYKRDTDDALVVVARYGAKNHGAEV